MKPGICYKTNNMRGKQTKERNQIKTQQRETDNNILLVLVVKIALKYKHNPNNVHKTILIKVLIFVMEEKKRELNFVDYLLFLR